MKRREFITLIGCAATSCVSWPLAARAQQGTEPLRVGFLGAASAAGYATRVDALRAGLRDLGYVEGRNLVFEARWAEDNYERLLTLARELVGSGCQVIVTHGTPGARAAKQASAQVAIVMAVSGDAVASKLVESLARPGGNVTGSSFFSTELKVKRLEQLKELLPQVKRLGYLFNPANPMAEINLPSVEKAAAALGLETQPFEVRTPAEVSAAFVTLADRRVQAVLIDDDSLLTGHAAAVAALALQHRIPAVGQTEFAQAGALIGYGPKQIEMFRRAAYFIDKIAKGAKPGDLPVEQPTKFELVVNLKAAQALGLEVPATLLARADEVIE